MTMACQLLFGDAHAQHPGLLAAGSDDNQTADKCMVTGKVHAGTHRTPPRWPGTLERWWPSSATPATQLWPSGDTWDPGRYVAEAPARV